MKIKVKPLKWKKNRQFPEEQDAVVGVFEYLVTEYGVWTVEIKMGTRNYCDVADGRAKSIKEAKAKCQQHFDKLVKKMAEYVEIETEE